jgi:hypothetical protein
MVRPKIDVAENSWHAHTAYLEDEVKKLDARADRLETIIPGVENEPKKHALQELLKQLQDEASEHRKYLALVKPK